MTINQNEKGSGKASRRYATRKPGRPRDLYRLREFKIYLIERLNERNWTIRELARRANVNRSTLWQVLERDRPCSRPDRIALLDTVGAAREDYRRFGCVAATEAAYELATFSPCDLHPELAKCRTLVSRSQYFEAEDEAERILNIARSRGDGLLQAHAAAVLGRVMLETLRFKQALIQFGVSGALIQNVLGLTEERILAQIGAGDAAPLSDDALSILSLALHGRFVALAEMVAFLQAANWAGAAMEAYWPTSQLDSHLIERRALLQFGFQKAHGVRRLGLLRAACTIDPDDDVPFKSLAAARQLSAAGGPLEAYITMDYGLCLAEADRKARAEIALRRASERLCELTDPKPLGIALQSISRIAIRRGERNEALRHALAAAAVCPYGFIREHGRARFATAQHADLAEAMEALHQGSEKPFSAVHEVLARVAALSGRNAEDLLEENLIRLLRGREPQAPEPRPLAA